jgi:hypothetical protein
MGRLVRLAWIVGIGACGAGDLVSGPAGVEPPATVAVDPVRSSNEEVVDASDARVTCPLHADRLEQDEVPIIYGAMPVPGYRAAERKSFPYARTEELRGCVRYPPNRARVNFCRKCRDVQAVWLKEHPEGEDGG